MEGRPDDPSPQVIFLHAATRDRSDFDALRALLPLPSAALDLPGHGAAPRYTAYDIPGMAAALDLADGAVVFAHSLGGCVALQCASLRPGRLAGLVLEEAPLFSILPPRATQGRYQRGFQKLRALLEGEASSYTPSDWERTVASWSSGHGGVSLLEALGPDAVRRRAGQLAALDPRVLDGLIDATMGRGFDPASAIRRAGCPTTLIAGEAAQGSVLSEEDLSRLKALGVRIVRVDGGHFIHEVRPEPCLAALCDPRSVSPI